MYWIALIITLLVWGFLSPIPLGIVAAPIMIVYRAISRDIVISPAHPVAMIALTNGAIVFAALTAYAWQWAGLKHDWSLWVPVLAGQVLAGISPGANMANIANTWAGIIGVSIYWIIS